MCICVYAYICELYAHVCISASCVFACVSVRIYILHVCVCMCVGMCACVCVPVCDVRCSAALEDRRCVQSGHDFIAWLTTTLRTPSALISHQLDASAHLVLMHSMFSRPFHCCLNEPSLKAMINQRFDVFRLGELL